MTISQIYTLALFLCTVLLGVILVINLNNKHKKQVNIAFSFVIICLMICCIGQLFSLLFADKWHIDLMYFDYFVYVGTCFLPVAFLFFAMAFAKTRITFKKKYLLFFVIPILTLLILWTNDFHHLFYVSYNISSALTTFGPYFYVHSFYCFLLLGISLVYLIKYSIRNAGFFSKQSILIIIGSAIPTVINLLGTLGVPMTIYLTPISFTVSVIFFTLAILKFKFLSIAPIDLQKIVDRISDGYIVLNDENNITDFNQTFLNIFHMEANNVRNKNFFHLVGKDFIDHKDLIIMKDFIIQARNSTETYHLPVKSNNKEQYFNVEINSIMSENSSLGVLVLWKDTTQHMIDMQTIQSSQEMLMEKERLASLGQLIGGIAHNLKTPIMSISGAAEGLSDLIKEYDSSIEDEQVTIQDHHDIAKDMGDWVEKIKTYTEYMSDVITAVKGQAVTLSEEQIVSFDLDELVKRIDILMRHELKNALVTLNVNIKTDKSTMLHGNITSLIQVINNMISNSIQAYDGEPGKEIDLTVSKKNHNLVISIQDYGPGLPKEVEDKLFKEMITTKGKNGTGLGLFMSYSTIRAHFNGNVTFSTKPGKGTIFNIILPL